MKSIMWDYANKATPGLITVKEKTGKWHQIGYRMFMMSIGSFANDFMLT